MNTDKIIARIASDLAQGDPVEGLTERLSATDLQSLMLHVYRERSRMKTPADLMSAYERASMVRPSTVDARALAEIARLAFECAAGFQGLQLAPLAPLGTNAVLGQIDQNNCLATARGAEVLADATTLAALECAHRRRAGHHEAIKLCSVSRQLRLQPFDRPGFSPHFELFSMVTAGRDRGSLIFEMESLREHLTVHVTLLKRLPSIGYRLSDIEVLLSHTERDEQMLRRVDEAVLQRLTTEHPSVSFRIDKAREQGRCYYKGYCIGVYAKNSSGNRMNLADGGFTDWTQRLLSNAKERLLTSGMGIELIPKLFK
jgi:hypothetical protein